LECEARQVAATLHSSAAMPPILGLARDPAEPLRTPDEDPGVPTFGPLDPSIVPRGGFRVELEKIGGKWYEIDLDTRNRKLASDKYSFVVQDGRVYASRYGHPEAALGKRVALAGEIAFESEGILKGWTAGSGSYRGAQHFAVQVGEKVGLDEGTFNRIPREEKGKVQLPVFPPKGSGPGPGKGTAGARPGTEPSEESGSEEVHMTPSGGGSRIGVGTALWGLVAGAAVLAVPLIKDYFARHYLREKWAAEERAMVLDAIVASTPKYNALITSRLQETKKELAAGRQVNLHVEVDTEWVDTDFGPAMIKAEVSYYTLLFKGDTPIEWPLFQEKRGFFATWLKKPMKTRRREAYNFPLGGTN
jgi:hypothetical protein